MNDCKFRDPDSGACEIHNIICNFNYQEIQEGDCDEYKSIYTKDDLEE